MHEQLEKSKENTKSSISNENKYEIQNDKQGTIKPLGVINQREKQSETGFVSSRQVREKENNTGMPNNLKEGIENLSGFAMDDVKVHYGSYRPAQLNAHAYAQGTEIHLAPGQEKQLLHEAWHTVQQKQGRVKPTLQMKRDIAINDDAELEDEADKMGAKVAALSMKDNDVLPDEQNRNPLVQTVTSAPVQRVKFQQSFSGPAIGTEYELSDALIFKTSSIQEIAVVRDQADNDLVEITSDMVSPAVLADATEETKQSIFSDYEPASVIDIDGESQRISSNLDSYTIELITHPALAKGQDNQLTEEASAAWDLRQSAFDFALDCIKTAGQADRLEDKHLAETSKDNLKLSLRANITHIIQTSGSPSFSPSSFQATYSQASEAIDTDLFLDASWLKEDVSTEVGNLSDIQGYDKIDESKRKAFKKAVEYAARIIKKVLAINHDKPLVGIDPHGTHNVHDPDVKNAWGMLPRTLVKDTVTHMIGSDEASMTAYTSYITSVKNQGKIQKSIIEKYITGDTGFARTTLSGIETDHKGASAFEIRSGGDEMHPYAAPNIEVVGTQTELWGEFYTNPDLFVYKKEKPKDIRYIYWHTTLKKFIYMKLEAEEKKNEAKKKWYAFDPKTEETIVWTDPTRNKTNALDLDEEREAPPTQMPKFLKP